MLYFVVTSTGNTLYLKGEKKMINKKRLIPVLLVLLALLAYAPGMVFAGTDILGGITLNFPDSYVSCTPSDTITTTGVPSNYRIFYFFGYVDGGILVELGSGWIDGADLNIPFPYPSVDSWTVDPATGNRFINAGATVVVFDETGTKVGKVGGQWTVTCPAPGEGCTPGFWRQPQHFDSWVGYSPTDDFETVFGVDASFDPHTLLDAVWLGSGGEAALARHAVAALLDATSPDVDYEFTEAEVIALVQEAYATGDFDSAKNQLAAENEAGCPID
jgi:hypothetical protein